MTLYFVIAKNNNLYLFIHIPCRLPLYFNVKMISTSEKRQAAEQKRIDELMEKARRLREIDQHHQNEGM